MAAPIKGKGTGKVSAGSWIGKLHGAATEANARAKADASERKEAGRSPQSIILRPNEVHGEYDAGRALYTTLGGVARAITGEDLIAFRQNIRTLQGKIKSGIRARQVLDMSLPSDRERAREEIRAAVPVSARNGLVRFITNAGPNSDVTRHHVAVDFLSFSAAVAAGRDNPKKMAAWMRKEPLRFDCDCGRHRYWFRYISTIGGFNAGRAETGYPKIRNPRLHGVACKHVLRVMAEVESSASIQLWLAKLIEKARAADDANANLRNTQAEAEALEKKQKGRAREIKTTDSRAKDREAARARQALAEAAKPAPKPKKTAGASRNAATLAGVVNKLKSLNMNRDQASGMYDGGILTVPKGTTKAQFLEAFDK